MKNVLTKRFIFTLKGNNDLVIDDAEDGELVQGSDKLLHTSIPAPVLMTIPLGTNGKKSKNKDKKDTPVQKPSSARKPSISQMQTETKSENTFTIENVEDNTNENVAPVANGHVPAEKLAKQNETKTEKIMPPTTNTTLTTSPSEVAEKATTPRQINPSCQQSAQHQQVLIDGEQDFVSIRSIDLETATVCD